ncbi:uncharacterized protein LOC132624363 [Lycium barbarum]|uniref:uncharacterized protein LOC132624363 n=1 Tax=Lycium barbarum TaxID=112863 RepID=UPI00293E36EE|nr:uncharacterized protein LOC132624363 [Lycium barbarum]
MEPSGGSLPAVPTVNPPPLDGATPSNPGNYAKLTFANAITAPSSSNQLPLGREKDKVDACQSIHNGVPAVIFKVSEYYGVVADECRYTLVGRFLKARPQIDQIRSSFKEMVTLKGSSQIGAFDNFNVFIDLKNEADFKNVWYRRVIEIDGMQMWLQKWTPDFKPEEDLPLALARVLLPSLPFHLYSWHYIKRLVCSIGTPLTLDAATSGRTRPSMAKVRIELDLLKHRLDSIWVGLEDTNAPLRGFYQKIEYEGVPKYCKHCRKLGHNMKEFSRRN